VLAPKLGRLSALLNCPSTTVVPLIVSVALVCFTFAPSLIVVTAPETGTLYLIVSALKLGEIPPSEVKISVKLASFETLRIVTV
jgi:hypothetical protein